MPCLLLLVVLAFPRVVLVLMFLLSNYLERAYHGLIIPLLGFIFLPLTTIVYAWLLNCAPPAGLWCKCSDPVSRRVARRGRARPRMAAALGVVMS